MQRFSYSNLFFFFFSALLIMLPFSKGGASTAYVILLLLSVYNFFSKIALKETVSAGHRKEKKEIFIKMLLGPALIFIALFISLLYSQNSQEGIDLLVAQSKMIGIPFLFYANVSLLQQKQTAYSNLFTLAVSIASLCTFVFFLLPVDTIKSITTVLSPLKEYTQHEKQHAFGAYSPFIDRLQFSYLIGVAFFLVIWQYFASSIHTTKKYLLLSCQLLVLFLTMLILGARGGQLGLIIGLAIWTVGIYFRYGHAILKKKIGKNWSYFLLGTGLFFTVIGLPLLAYQYIPAITIRYNQMIWELGTFQDGTFKNYDYTNFTSIRRLLSWRNSWFIIQDHPILGVGIGDYQSSMQVVYNLDGLGFPVNTQSQLLYYWVSAGLLGIIVFLVIWGHWFYQLIVQKGYWLRILGSAIFAFYTFVFLLDAPLNFQVGSMTFWWSYSFLSLLLNLEINNQAC